MGGVGLFVAGVGLGVVIMLFGVIIVVETDHQWIPILSAVICGLVVAGICIVVSRYSLTKKPSITRDKIVEFCGDLPRIELFARQAVDGWDCWGNEV